MKTVFSNPWSIIAVLLILFATALIFYVWSTSPRSYRFGQGTVVVSKT